MNCLEFQKIIPKIMNHSIPIELMGDAVAHAEECKACRDELEINYVLKYGLSEDAQESMDIIGHVDTDMTRMQILAKHFRWYKSALVGIQLTAACAVIGSLIYCAFKIWF